MTTTDGQTCIVCGEAPTLVVVSHGNPDTRGPYYCGWDHQYEHLTTG